jgi:hypothetical protein
MIRNFKLSSALLIIAGVPAFADVINLVTDRGSLQGNDQINWGQLPVSITFLNGSQSVTSDAGLGATVTTSTGAFYTDQQGNPWQGNFAAGDFAQGDFLIGTGQFDSTPATPIDITFSSGVSAVGAQMGYNVITSSPYPFVEGIHVYNSSNDLLATFTVPGFMDDLGNNSAVFIGVQDLSGANIARVQFFTTTQTGPWPGSFAINQLSLVDSVDSVTTLDAVATPEPKSLTLFGTAALGVLAIVKKRRSRA